MKAWFLTMVIRATGISILQNVMHIILDGFPLSAHVVISLSTDLFNKSYCIYFENFYTSPDLSKKGVDVVAQ